MKGQVKDNVGVLFIFLFVALLFLSCEEPTERFDLEKLDWPEVTKTTRPWSRWWWMGSAVNKKDLAAEMVDYKEHGLGGLEVTPIYGVKGKEDQFIQYLSSEWMDMYEYVLKQGEELGIGIDMDNASSWPFGGPWVKSENESKSIFHKIYRVEGGEKLEERIQYRQEGMISTNGKSISLKDVKRPLDANDNMQELSLFQVIFSDDLPLQALVAYSNKGEVIKLKDKVDSSGYLNWIAPEGEWVVYAVFIGKHGKMVERAAPGGEGYVVDPFSKKALRVYLDRFDDAFKGYNLEYTRAFFQDSYEYDDGHGQADWTPEFFEEFEKYRGYDLRDHLPALFGNDSLHKNQRIIADYRETVSDLLLHNYTLLWKEWAKKHGGIIRNQAHGSPANILDLYGISDIPETEGYDPIKAKFASSAGHIMNKPLISTESATWMDEHFVGTLSKVKETVNMFLLNGINHIFYHGTTYSPRNEKWPGWLFYAAVNFSPSNSFWDDFTALNTYVTRVQSFLQEGQPDNDILLYYPIFDYWSQPGSQMLENFDGSGKGKEDSDFYKLSNALLDRGYSFDFISDRQIHELRVKENLLETGNLKYKTIILPKSRYIPIETMNKLIELAENGASIIVHDAFPKRVAGFKDWEQNQVCLKRIEKDLNFLPDEEGKMRMAEVKDGKLLVLKDIEEGLSNINVGREKMVDDGLEMSRRKTKFGNYYFIVNKNSEAIDRWIPIRQKGEAVAIFDPQTAQFGMGKVRHRNNGLEVYLQLDPGESVILNVFKDQPESSAKDYPYYQLQDKSQSLSGEWEVEFIKGGPSLPGKYSTKNLGSWTDFNLTGVAAFSGTARYTLNFPKPQGDADAWLLKLGKVLKSARVSLNKEILDTLISPPYQVIVPGDILEEENTLVVEVSNLMANRIAYMDREGIKWKNFYNLNFPPKYKENMGEDGFFDASGWEVQQSGLLGPVTLKGLNLRSFK